jgi:hypothetical protein
MKRKICFRDPARTVRRFDPVHIQNLSSVCAKEHSAETNWLPLPNVDDIHEKASRPRPKRIGSGAR